MKIYLISERGGEEPDNYETPLLWTGDKNLAYDMLKKLDAVTWMGMPQDKERGYWHDYVRARPERRLAYVEILGEEKTGILDLECEWVLREVDEIISSDELPT